MQIPTPRQTSYLNVIHSLFVPLVGLPAVPNTRDTKDTKSSSRSDAPVASRGRPRIAEAPFQRCLKRNLNLEQAADWLKPLIQRGAALTTDLVKKLLPRVNGRDLNDKQAQKIIYAAEERSPSPSRRVKTTYIEQLPAPAADGPEGSSSALRKFHVEGLGESNTFRLTSAERDGKGNVPSRETSLSEIRGPAALKADFFAQLAQLDESPRKATGHLRASHGRNAFPRTWPYEKIGRIVEEVLEKNEANLAKAYEKVREERRYYVVTAFIENVVSAGSVESDQVDEANRLLTGITEPSIREFMATNYKKENSWVTLAIAETVNANADRTCLTARDQEVLRRAMSLLCVGESRHPRHQRLIDDTRRQFTMPDGWTR